MGNFILIYGPMFSGKTEDLLRRATREEIAGNKVVYFKPNIDDRYDSNKIMTHNLGGKDAFSVDNSDEIIKILKNIDWEIIVIDEIQFLDSKIIDIVKHVVFETDKKIIASGLVLDFRSEPFPLKDFSISGKTMADLLVFSNPKKIHAVCTYKDENGKICGKDALYTQRIIDNKPASYNSPVILVGSTDSYEARCKEHYFLYDKPKTNLDF